MEFETKAIHCGDHPNLADGGSGDVVTPLHLASTFSRSRVDIPTAGYEYSRSGNPTRCALEQKLAALENAQYGLAFASGLAAISTVFLSLLQAGDHVIAFDDLYGGTRRLFSQVFAKRFNIEISYVDARVTDQVANSIRPNTRLIWLETPTNPLLKLCDLKQICKLANTKKISTVVDNTFMSPYYQKPLSLGATLVMHSTTKYINGHSDSVGGALMLNDEALFETLKYHQNAVGGILAPFDSFLVSRGIKTLALRMERHASNAQKIAEYLENHPKVKRVIYPGLSSHPQHALAKSQMEGFGGMISFELHANLDQAKIFVESLQFFHLAESLGGIESLVELPSLMTHASIPLEERHRIGLNDSLVRLSVGCEAVTDLLNDLENSLRKVS